MGFQEHLARHVEQVRVRLPHLKGEEATKQALVIPLLQVLGYDVFDPREVRPEYTADFAVKRAGQLEKIDYAICTNGEPVLFIECKAHDQALEDHSGQLSRYFNATPSVRIAVITNGVKLRVFTDLRQPNVMDASPWLEMDLLALKPVEVEALRRLRKAEYASEAVVALAEEMVYYSSMTAYMAQQLRDPSEAFVRHVAGEVLSSMRLTKNLVERLAPILKKATQAAVLENVAKSFAAPQAAEAPAAPASEAPVESQERAVATSDGVETTESELGAFELIAGWIRETHSGATVAYRDSKTYFTIHQNNVRKWFVRMNVQRPPYWVAFRHVAPEDLRLLAPGLPVVTATYGDSRVALGSVDEVRSLRAAIIAAYDREALRSDDGKGDETAATG